MALVALTDTQCYPQFAGKRITAASSIGGTPSMFYDSNGNAIGLTLYGDENGIMHSVSLDGDVVNAIYLNQSSIVSVYAPGDDAPERRFYVKV